MQDHNESGDNSGPGGAQGMRGVSSQRVLAALAISALGAAAVNWAPAELVEDLYCKRLYPLIFHAQARLLEGLPFSVSEVGLVLLVLLLGLRAFLSVRKVVSQEVSFGALIIAALRRALWLCCIVYCCFLLLWGFHHARRPYAVHVGLQESLEQAEAADLELELTSLCLDLAASCNSLRSSLNPHRLELVGEGARGGTDAVAAMTKFAAATPIFHGLRPRFRVAAASRLLSRLGISGIYSPFSGDAHVNGDIPDWSQPFTARHEMAHQLGIAAEGEANFVAWQACQSSKDAGLLYSANMVALGLGLNALAIHESSHPAQSRRAAQIVETLSDEVRQDRHRASVWWMEQLGVLSDLAELSNDAYLRSHGQAEGVTSYSLLIDLILAERRKSNT